MEQEVIVVGAGLAGCEAAYWLAERGVRVRLIDGKPQKRSPAHTADGFAELVCSNSLKSDDAYGNACGLLKEEMRVFGSLTMEAAAKTRVPAGGALAVDRAAFSAYVTQKVCSHPNISCETREVTELPEAGGAIVATGPLTFGALAEDIRKKLGEGLHFFDAAAPIVAAESVDFTKAFIADRYGKGSGDYVNCPLTKEEYEAFAAALAGAERALVHDFDKRDVFEGCMPAEIMAARGKDSLRFGMMKPVGLYDQNGKRPYAVVQLRKENAAGTAYNLVGFQTNLRFGEQARVFRMIPALKNAEFLRYGVMHRNTYLDSPNVLNADYSCKKFPQLYFAGQLTGVEGYVESAGSGIAAAMNVYCRLKGKPPLAWTDETVTGALAQYISSPNEDFQPMNANYGILRPLGEDVRDKAKKRRMFAERAMARAKELAAHAAGIQE